MGAIIGFFIGGLFGFMIAALCNAAREPRVSGCGQAAFVGRAAILCKL